MKVGGGGGMQRERESGTERAKVGQTEGSPTNSTHPRVIRKPLKSHCLNTQTSERAREREERDRQREDGRGDEGTRRRGGDKEWRGFFLRAHLLHLYPSFRFCFHFEFIVLFALGSIFEAFTYSTCSLSLPLSLSVRVLSFQPLSTHSF